MQVPVPELVTVIIRIRDGIVVQLTPNFIDVKSTAVCGKTGAGRVLRASPHDGGQQQHQQRRQGNDEEKRRHG